jgi:hypothetical protein
VKGERGEGEEGEEREERRGEKIKYCNETKSNLHHIPLNQRVFCRF